jgi:hypothetical protein
MLKVKLPYLDNATITNQRDCNPEYWKKCQMSNSSWKLNGSILYYVPHSCDNTAYTTYVIIQIYYWLVFNLDWVEYSRKVISL